MADNRIVGGGFTDDQRPTSGNVAEAISAARRRSRSLLRRLSAIPRRVRRDRFPLMNAGDGKRHIAAFISLDPRP